MEELTHRLQLRKPIVFFDLETTGTNLANDRIVQFCLIKAKPDGSTEVITRLVNPTIPIPYESSVVHGILDDDVKDQPTFAQLATTVADFIGDSDLGGFNVIKFDLPLLVEEFLRAEVSFNPKDRLILDAQKIYHLMEPRNLSAAHQFYTGQPIESIGHAHDAETDTIATLRVFDEQVQRYAGQNVDLGNGPVTLDHNPATYFNITNQKTVDLAGRFGYNSRGDVVFNFGKHKDKLVAEVLRREPSYYDWMMNGDFPRETKDRLTEIRNQVRGVSA